MYYLLEKHGIPRRHNKENSRKFTVDNEYFSSIDTPEKAYWLGFIFADGSIGCYGTQSILKIDLHQRDQGHLEKLLKDLSSTYKINTFTQTTSYGVVPVARLQITSDELVDSLIRLGCVERKSLILQPPKIDDFHRDFIRGLIDGDGSIAKSKVSLDGFRLKLTGTYDLLEWVNTHYPRKGSIYPSRNVFSLEAHSDNIVWLYESASRYLDRKYERFRELQQNQNARHVLTPKE